MPPLRERKEDIPLLVEHFLKLHTAARTAAAKRLGDGVLELLEAYDWPGNVRELENEVKLMIALGDDVIARGRPLRGRAPRRKGCRPASDDGRVKNLVELVETSSSREIEKALRTSEGNKTRAADAARDQPVHAPAQAREVWHGVCRPRRGVGRGEVAGAGRAASAEDSRPTRGLGEVAGAGRAASTEGSRPTRGRVALRVLARPRAGDLPWILEDQRRQRAEAEEEGWT